MSTTTKAKVYLGADDYFSVSNNGATIYGNTGSDGVTIASGVSGVIIDQNIERLNFSGSSSSYTFKQTGNKINVFDAMGTTLLASAPVQGDGDGTLLSFSNGMASAILAGGVMALGGARVATGTAGSLLPTLVASTLPTANSTKAKVYFGANDSFNVSNNGATLYGNTGNDAVTIDPGVSGVIIDQNIERIVFSGASSSYAFKQTGNKMNVYDVAGVTLLASAPVQGDSDGTVFAFSNGNASAHLAGGVMSLAGTTVSATAATPLNLVGIVTSDFETPPSVG